MHSYMTKTRFWIGDVDPNRVGAELEAIAAENGGEVPTESVRERARHAESPLHAIKHWSWNLGRKKAADQWDLHVARNVSASVLVTFEKRSGAKTQPVQAFREDPATNQRRATTALLEDPRDRAALIAQYIGRLRRLERELDALVELGDLLRPVYTRLERAAEEARGDRRAS